MNEDTKLCIGFTYFDPRFAFFWSIVSHCAKEQAEALGVKLISKPALNVTDQIVEIQKLLEQKIDALLITPIESGHPGLISAIEAVNAAGIPVVALDSEVGGGKVLSTVRSDNIKGEEMVTEYFFDCLGGKGKVIHLQGDLKVEVGAHRSKGFHNVLSRYPEIELVFETEGNWYRDRGDELTLQALAQHPDIQAVIAGNDQTALGACDAIAKVGRSKEIMIAGFDAIPEALLSMYEGQMTATVQQNADGMARKALQAAIQGIRGEAVPSLLLTKVELITSDNLLKTTVNGLYMLPGVLRDLEEQKRELSKANELLEQHRDQLEGLVTDRTYELTRQKYILDTFMDNIPDYIYFKDTQSRITRSNGAYAIKMGVKDPGELIGKNDFDFFPVEQAEAKYQQEQKIIKTGQPILNLEEPVGIDHWAMTTKMPLRDEKGAIIGIFGISSDITELVKTKQAMESRARELEQAYGTLANERNLLHTLIDNLPDHIYAKDAEGRFTLGNVSLARHMGANNPDELIGKNDFDFYPPDLAMQFHTDEQALIQSNQSLLNHEESTRDPTGQPKWNLTTKVLLQNSQGKKIGLVGIGRDITERKQAETEREQLLAELTRQQYILDTFMDNIPDRIYFKDTQSRMTRTNRAFAKKLGTYDPEELIGKSDFDYFPADQAEIKYQQEQEIIKTGQPILALEEPDGIDAWALTTKMPLRDEKGIIIGTFGISRDITDLVKTKQTMESRALELQKAYETLQKQQQILLLAEKMASLGRLTAGIAHEMNTPLATVRAALVSVKELINEYQASIGDDSVTDKDHYEIARELLSAAQLAEKAAERAAGFVRGIKSQTRSMAAQEHQSINTVVAVEDALLLLSHALKQGKCELDFKKPDIDIRVVGMPGRVEQIVTNLVNNAIDASQPQGGLIRVCLNKHADCVELQISDHGSGIPPENLSKIFDPMFSSKPFGSSTGLGLTIVHDIVVGEFGGSIDVSSPPGQGATFTIRLPAER